MEERAWKQILKPNLLKIIVFIILLLVVSILPLYPTHYNEVRMFSMSDSVYDSGTTVESLYFVLDGDFNWTEREEAPGMTMTSTIPGLWTHTDTSFSADPIFLALYIPYAIIAYCIGCFIIEYLNWWNKHNKTKGLKDL